jgi:hypothetical protein
MVDADIRTGFSTISANIYLGRMPISLFVMVIRCVVILLKESSMANENLHRGPRTNQPREIKIVLIYVPITFITRKPMPL